MAKNTRRVIVLKERFESEAEQKQFEEKQKRLESDATEKCSQRELEAEEKGLERGMGEKRLDKEREMEEKRFERELEAKLQSEKFGCTVGPRKAATRKSEGGTRKYQSSSRSPIGSIESSW